MKLELVKRDAEFSIYRNVRGELVYLTDPPVLNTVNPPLYKLDAARVFNSQTSLRHEHAKALNRGQDSQAFLAWLRVVLSEPARVDEISWCVRCGNITATGLGAIAVADGNSSACHACARYYTECRQCKQLKIACGTRDRDGYHMCEECRDENYSYCPTCGSYYLNEIYNRDHKHGNGCCESPAPEFSIRHLDNPPLVNDVKTTVVMGAGKIDQAGYERIKAYLVSQCLYNEADLVDKMEPTWQMKRGNWPKRFSTQVYKKWGTKLDANVLAMLGTIGAEHSAKGTEVVVMISRDLNRPASWWFHSGSCWWTSASDSRCAMKTNGGFGILSYQGPRHVRSDGRAWVLPVRRSTHGYLAPTFETMDPDGFVVFNGYGTLEGYAGARVVAGLTGMTYRRVTFGSSPLHVNSGGFLIGSEEFVEPYTDGGIRMQTMLAHSELWAEEQRAKAAAKAAAEAPMEKEVKGDELLTFLAV